MALYLIAYDIASDRKRKEIAQLLLRRGERIQQSVFEVRLDPNQLRQLLREVGPRLSKQDAFDIVPVDERDVSRRIRWQREPISWDGVIVV